MCRIAKMIAVSCAAVGAGADMGHAQRWWDEGMGSRRTWEGPGRGVDRERGQPYWDFQSYGRAYAAPPRMAPRALSNEVRDGGPRPEIVPVAPPVVAFAHDYPAGSIVIDTEGKRLYYVLPGRQAYAYVIAVGREGFDWTGVETVSRKQDWPDWHPPAEMRERDPSLPAKMTGGLRNPLGATALYLGNTLYRIHGTNDERSLGQAGSSGCFRMMNANVAHLASITEIGTKVHVVAALEPPRRVSEAGQAPRYARPQPRVQSPPPRWTPEWRWQDRRDYRVWRDDPYWRGR